MLVWALKILGCCIAVWLVGSIGGVRASIGAMAQAIAVVVGACAMLFRFPIWAPQFSFFVRVGIIVVYYFTRRPRPKHLGEGFVFIAPSHAQFESKNDRRRDESAKAKKDHHGKPPSGRVVASSTSGSWKTTVVTASVAQAGFLILAGVSFMNNTIITCSYREHLSLRELIFIAVKEHGACYARVRGLSEHTCPLSAFCSAERPVCCFYSSSRVFGVVNCECRTQHSKGGVADEESCDCLERRLLGRLVQLS